MLLVLDNFEQIIDAAPVVGELLAAASRLTVLVTSREPLGITVSRSSPSRRYGCRTWLTAASGLRSCVGGIGGAVPAASTLSPPRTST